MHLEVRDMRLLVLLIALLVSVAPVLAQPQIHLGPVIVSITSGQQSVVLRCDERGLVGLKEGQRWRLIGQLDSSGTLSTGQGVPNLALGEEGGFESGGDFTPLKLDDQAMVSMNDVEVFQVQGSNFRQIMPAEQAIGRALSSVRIEGAPGTDQLAAYLIVTYLLLL